MEYPTSDRAESPPQYDDIPFASDSRMHPSPPPEPTTPLRSREAPRTESLRSKRVTLVRRALAGQIQAGMAKDLDVGVGLRCARDAITGNMVVTHVLFGGPADESRLIFVGDALKYVNGVAVSDMQQQETGMLLLGNANTRVTLELGPNTIATPAPPPERPPRASRAPHIQPPAHYQPSPMANPTIPFPSKFSTGAGAAEVSARVPDIPAVQVQIQSDEETVAQKQLIEQQQLLSHQQRQIELFRLEQSREEEAEERLRAKERVRAARIKRQSTPHVTPGVRGTVNFGESPTDSTVGAASSREPVYLSDYPDFPSVQPTHGLSRHGDDHIPTQMKQLSLASPALSSSAQEPQVGTNIESVVLADMRLYPTPSVSAEESEVESLSLTQLKINFQQRMNEAIRQQRERMRTLLNDVDSKILTLKLENGLGESETRDAQGHNSSKALPVSSETTVRVFDSSSNFAFEKISPQRSNDDDSVHRHTPASVDAGDSPVAEPAISRNDAIVVSVDFPEERSAIKESHTERLMREMSALRAELKAAVNGSPGAPMDKELQWNSSASDDKMTSLGGHRPLAPQLLGEAELPPHEIAPPAAESVYAFEGIPPMDTALSRNTSVADEMPSSQLAGLARLKPEGHGQLGLGTLSDISKAHLPMSDTLSDISKQKFLDIVGKLQQESNRSLNAPPPLLDPAAIMRGLTSFPLATEGGDDCASVSDDGSDDGDSAARGKIWNRDTRPVKGCLQKEKKRFPNRPVTPPQDPRDPRLADNSSRRSILGASIAASVEVLNPGLKTPYSPDHVMSPHGPMVISGEGLVAPLEHPFVQEQMHVISMLRENPDLADKPPEVVKALSVRAELLGFNPEVLVVKTDELQTGSIDIQNKPRSSRGITFDANAAQEDGDSATRLHLEAMIKRNQLREEQLRQRHEMMLMLQQHMLQQQLVHLRTHQQSYQQQPHQGMTNQVISNMPRHHSGPASHHGLQKGSPKPSLAYHTSDTPPHGGPHPPIMMLSTPNGKHGEFPGHISHLCVPLHIFCIWFAHCLLPSTPPF